MTWLGTCREVRERLTDYDEGVLPWPERMRIRAHLLICSACSAFHRGLRALPGVGRWLLGPEQPPPAEARQALGAVLRRIGKP